MKLNPMKRHHEQEAPHKKQHLSPEDQEWHDLLHNTTIKDLLKERSKNLIVATHESTTGEVMEARHSFNSILIR